MFLLCLLPLLSPLAAAELDVAPFKPAPGDAAAFRNLAGGTADETPAARLDRLKTAFDGKKPEKPSLLPLLDRLEGGRIESGRAGNVNSVAFADPEKRRIQLLLWNSGGAPDFARLKVSDAERFFGAARMDRALRLPDPASGTPPETVHEKLTVADGTLTFEVGLPPGAAALVELLPDGTEADTTVRVDAKNPLTLRIPQIPGSGHFHVGFEARAESPAAVTLEVIFMRRQRFLAVRNLIVTVGGEWKLYRESYPIPAGTTHVVCKVTGGPAEIRALGPRK